MIVWNAHCFRTSATIGELGTILSKEVSEILVLSELISSICLTKINKSYSHLGGSEK